MIDAGRITTLKIDARRGHNNVHDCKELLSLLTLAEREAKLRNFADLMCDILAKMPEPQSGEWNWPYLLEQGRAALSKGTE